MSTRAGLVVSALILIGALVTQTWQLDACEHRVTQLECALAQANALLAEESLSTGDLGLDMP